MGSNRKVQTIKECNLTECKFMKKYHLLPRESGWKLTLSGFEYPIESYSGMSRNEAYGLASKIVNGVGYSASLRVYRPDGSFEKEHTCPLSVESLN